MFRSTNRAAGFAQPTQGTRIIALEDLDLPTENVEHKVQLNGNTTALFVDAYKQEKGPKIIEGYVPKGYPKPISPAAAWAKAESDLAIVRALYNRTLSVVETQKFLQRIYTPQSYLPPSVASIAQATIAQAASTLRPPGTQVPSTQVPETRPAGTQPPIVQPPGSAAPIVQPPGSAAPIVQPPGSAAPIVQPPGSAAPIVQPPGSAAPIVQPPGSAAPPTGQAPVGPPTAQELQADADLVSKLKTIQPTDADSLALTALSYKDEPDFEPTSMPTLAMTTALAPYYPALMRRVNMLIYNNADPMKAEEFVIIISNGGYQYVYKAFTYLLKQTPQFKRFIELLGNVVTFFIGKTIILLRFTSFVYTMTCFYLLQDAPLAIPTDADIEAATRKAIDFTKFGMKTFLRYIFQSSTVLPSMVKFATGNPPTIPQLEPTEAEKQATLQKVEQDLEALTSAPPRYVDEPVVANLSDVNVSGTSISGPAAQAIGDGGEAGEEVVETLIEKFWETLFGQVPGTVAVVATGLSSLSGSARLFRTLAFGSVFGLSAVFMGLNTFAFGYGVPVSFVMLLNILQQTYAGFLASGTVTRLQDENVAMRQDIGIRNGMLNSLQAQMRTLSSALAESALVDVGDVGRNVAGLLERVFNRGYQQAVVDLTSNAALSNILNALGLKTYTMGADRQVIESRFRAALIALGVPEANADAVIRDMTTGGVFRFYGSDNTVSDRLYNALDENQSAIKARLARYFVYKNSLPNLNPRLTVAEEAMRQFTQRFGENNKPGRVFVRMNIEDKTRWSILFSVLFGLTPEQVAKVWAYEDEIPQQQPETIIGETGDGSRPGEEGTARAVSVPTPQYTDAPPSITLEAALELLQDNTNSVEQITRSNAPDSYKWVLVKYRRESLRALWYAVFVGLGIPGSDATQALNFLTPTFVDASKNVNEYSGIRTNGAHGVYPRLDQFFTRNRNVINKDFASRSPQIRVKYAAVFFSRFFGLRGKYYAKDLFALSTTELSQAAQLSRIAIDVLQMDATHSDGQPPERMPTAADLRGYRTGPDDFTNKIIVN